MVSEGTSAASQQRARQNGSAPSAVHGVDWTKDLGTVALFLLSLGSTFWVSEFSSYTLVEEWPVATLATLTAAGTVLSAILLRVRAVPTTVAHLLRLVPAGLLTAATLVYLLAMSVGQGVSASAPGLGYGFLIMISLGVIAALPRSGDPIDRDRRIWMWWGTVIVICGGVANTLLPFFSSEWDAKQFSPVGIVLNVLMMLLPLLALWRKTSILRPALRIVGLTMVLVTVLNGRDPDLPVFAGEFGAALGLFAALLVAGLLALGLPNEKQTGRRFALTASIVALVIALLYFAPSFLLLRSSWDMAAASVLPMLGAAIALVAFVAVHSERRRAHVLPALIAAAALFAVTTGIHVSEATWFSSTSMAGVPLALFTLTVVALVRLDRDPGFDILPPRFRVPAGAGITALDVAEARSYQQSAAVLSALSIVTGPAGILLSLSAFHRAGHAEQAGLQTTAIRIIAGAGMTVGVLSIVAWPFWAATLGAS